MFRFKGHFEAPNNPDLPEQDQQRSVSLAAEQPSVGQGLKSLIKADRSRTVSHPAESVMHAPEVTAEVATVQAMPQYAGNHTDADADLQQDKACIPAGRHATQHSKTANTAHQQTESAFRRSHSPEWYDARFKRYVLR